MVGEVGQGLGVQPGLPDRFRAVGAAAQERVVDVAQTDLGDRPGLRPVPVAPEGVAGQGDRPAGGLEEVPVDVGAKVVERGEGEREPLALVLPAADRGQRRPGRPRGLQALADGVAEDGVGADLQEDVVAVGGEAVDGGPEPYPFAYVLPPVVGVQLTAPGHAFGTREVERKVSRARLQGGQCREQVVLDPLHADTVVRDLYGEELGEQLLGPQLLGQQGRGVRLSGERDRGGAVDGGDRDPVPVGAHPALRLVLRQAHREHGARPGQGLLEAAAVHRDPGRVLEGVDARLMEGGDLPGAVSDDGVRGDTVRPPQCRETDLEGEVGGLGEPGLAHAGGGFVGGQLLDQGPVGELPQRAVASGDRLSEYGFVPQELAAHPPPLGSHTGEDPDQAPRFGVPCAVLNDPGVGLATLDGGECLVEGGARGVHDGEPVREVLAAVGQGVAEVGQGHRRAVLPGQFAADAGRQLREGVRVPGAERQDAPGPFLGSGCVLGGCRGLLQDDVGVGPAESERVHTGTCGALVLGPGGRPGGDLVRQRGLVDGGVEALQVDVGRDVPVFEAEDGLDQPSDPGGGLGVPDVGLHGPDVRAGPRLASDGQGTGQGSRLDRVADGGGGAVRLHVLEVTGRDAGLGADPADEETWASGLGTVMPLVWPSWLTPLPRITAWIRSPSRTASSSRFSATRPTPSART